jgi:trans-feruloyl-CoA hydratase/vanillin synthase
MATSYETLLLTKADGITTITFNRPEKRNAMSPQLHREMFDCSLTCATTKRPG